MTNKTTIAAATLLFIGACQSSAVPNQSETEITSCMRTVMKLDEGRWNYMGTIARLGGTFRTYETTSIHASTGPDTWSSKSFGGDVGGTELAAEAGHIKLVGTSMVPLENGELNLKGAIKYLSCVGPDPEGRYETNIEYSIPNGDGTSDFVKNISWYSEHGSYYVEDHINEEGRVVARRSGVNTPAGE